MAEPEEPLGPIVGAEPPVGTIVQWLPGKPLTDDYRWCDGTGDAADYPDLIAAGVTWIPNLRPTPATPPIHAIRVRR